MSCHPSEFEQIYVEFQPKIHRFLMGMVGLNEAEDLTQEVFIRVSKALDAFRGEAKLSTWIYRIATNAAFDRLRSPDFRMNPESCTDDAAHAPGAAKDEDGALNFVEKVPLVEQQVYRKEMNECILGYVNSLPQKYRAVLVLSEFEELNNLEIAEILGVSVGTVKIRLHRAREKVKSLLAQNCGAEWVEGNEFVPELKPADYSSLKE